LKQRERPSFGIENQREVKGIHRSYGLKRGTEDGGQ